MKNKTCDICGQKTDIYTGVHKKSPFVDGKNYAVVCFTCFFVPKTLEQKYKHDGSLEEETEIPYSCQHLMSPKDMHEQGAADSLGYAKKSVAAVSEACRGIKPPKKPQKRPSPSWNVC